MMNYSLLQLAAPLVCFAADVVIQLSGNRIIKSLGVLKSELLGFIFGFLGVIAIELFIYFSGHNAPLKDLVAVTLANLLIFTSLSYCYFHFVNLAITARRIRLLRDLYASEDGLTMEGILAQYSAKDMVGNRIKRLIGSSQIVKRDCRYFIGKPVVLTIVKIILMLKLIVLGKKSEFD